MMTNAKNCKKKTKKKKQPMLRMGRCREGREKHEKESILGRGNRKVKHGELVMCLAGSPTIK